MKDVRGNLKTTEKNSEENKTSTKEKTSVKKKKK
jgi:hypothetical protein